jgi:hypothetical protein
MSTEHDEQSTELTYPTNDEQPTELTTIRLVLASDDSDKENHIPDIRRDEITVKLEQKRNWRFKASNAYRRSHI